MRVRLTADALADLAHIKHLAFEHQLFLIESVVADVAFGDLVDLLELFLVLIEFLVGDLLLLHGLNDLDVLLSLSPNARVALLLQVKRFRSELGSFATRHTQ